MPRYAAALAENRTAVYAHNLGSLVNVQRHPGSALWLPHDAHSTTPTASRDRAFGRGELDTAEQIRIRFVAGRAAGSARTPAAVAAARAAGQAAGVAHMGAHALGAAAYAAKAAALAAGDPESARREEVRWQLQRLTPEARDALSRLPLLGTDSAGPLGPGLLTTGVLATTIREIQAALGASRSS